MPLYWPKRDHLGYCWGRLWLFFGNSHKLLVRCLGKMTRSSFWLAGVALRWYFFFVKKITRYSSWPNVIYWIFLTLSTCRISTKNFIPHSFLKKPPSSKCSIFAYLELFKKLFLHLPWLSARYSTSSFPNLFTVITNWL